MKIYPSSDKFAENMIPRYVAQLEKLITVPYLTLKQSRDSEKEQIVWMEKEHQLSFYD